MYQASAPPAEVHQPFIQPQYPQGGPGYAAAPAHTQAQYPGQYPPGQGVYPAVPQYSQATVVRGPTFYVPSQADPKKGWSHDLCGCLQSPGGCETAAYVLCCTPCAAGDVARASGRSYWCVVGPGPADLPVRRWIRPPQARSQHGLLRDSDAHPHLPPGLLGDRPHQARRGVRLPGQRRLAVCVPPLPNLCR